jgi:YVTN family beta-propeller protein
MTQQLPQRSSGYNPTFERSGWLGTAVIVMTVIWTVRNWLISPTSVWLIESGTPTASFAHNLLLTLGALISIAMFVLVGLWLGRARRNADRIAPDQQRRSKVWVWLSWIVPIVNLWFPKQVIDDVWRSTVRDPRVPKTGWWWGTWIAYEIPLRWLELVLWVKVIASNRASIGWVISLVLADVMVAIAAVFWIRVVRTISHAQDTLSAEAGTAETATEKQTPPQRAQGVARDDAALAVPPQPQASPVPQPASAPLIPIPGIYQERTQREDQNATATRAAQHTWETPFRVTLAAALVILVIVVIGVLMWTRGTTAIPVGDEPHSVAITPDGRRIYVTNYASGNVSVIDTNSNSVITTIPVGDRPEAVAITPDGHAYITTFDLLVVIDTTSNTITTTIPDLYPTAVAITPDGHHAYVTNGGIDSMSIINTTSNTVTTTIPIPYAFGSHRVAITPDGHHAYITHPNSDTVSVIDTTSNTVTTTIVVGVGGSPHGVAITPDGHHAYIANHSGGNVSVIDTASNTITTTIPASLPMDVAISPDGHHAYITTFGHVMVIDTTSNAVSTTIPIGQYDFPEGVAITPDGHHAYITTPEKDTVLAVEVEG